VLNDENNLAPIRFHHLLLSQRHHLPIQIMAGMDMPDGAAAGSHEDAVSFNTMTDQFNAWQ